MTNGTAGAPGAPGAQPAGRKVLVVDDEHSIRDLLTTALTFVGFEVETASDGLEALATTATFRPDLIVLDVMMPRLDGIEVCRRLRDGGDNTPVIFLTARDDTTDHLAGFATGADDYLTKPFHLQLLVARVEAVLRRTQQPTGAPKRKLAYADVELDDAGHRAWRDGQRLDLSPTEFKLLRYFLLNAEIVLSKSQIMEHVWQYDFGGDPNVVETYVSYLRKKLDHTPPKLIHTVRGVGYTLRHEDA